MVILVKFLKAAVFFAIGALMVLATVALMAAKSPDFPPGQGSATPGLQH